VGVRGDARSDRHLTIRRQAGERPSDSWSLGNRLLVLMADTEDARGFLQWEQAGRHVVKGARAVYILGPIARKVHGEDPATGEPTERTIIRGFKAIPVFRLEDTEGKALEVPDYAPPVLPPLAEVAEAWGIKVAYRPDRGGGYYGAYSPTAERIELVTHAEMTFFHELAHAAHRRLGGLTSAGQDPRQEIVAETSAAALCLMYGLQGYVAPAAQYVAGNAGVGADDAARGRTEAPRRDRGGARAHPRDGPGAGGARWSCLNPGGLWPPDPPLSLPRRAGLHTCRHIPGVPGPSNDNVGAPSGAIGAGPALRPGPPHDVSLFRSPSAARSCVTRCEPG